MSGHTPGKWSLDQRNGFYVIAGGGALGCAQPVVARLAGMESDEARQNALVMIAAPDLLGACQEAADLCVGTFAEGGSAHKRILAAIRKATEGDRG